MSTRTLPPGVYQPSPGRFAARIRLGGVDYHGGTHGSVGDAVKARNALRDRAVAASVASTGRALLLDADTFDAAGPTLPELPHHGYGRARFRNELSRARAW